MTPAPDTPKRLTLSQIVELLLTRPVVGDRSAVTLTSNAAGETQIEVKVRAGDSEDVGTVEEAAAKAAELYESLRARYPRGDEHDNAEIALTRNAKGETQIAVEVKTSPRGNATLVDAAEYAYQVYDGTRRRYPMADGNTARPGSVALDKPERKG